MENKIKKIKEYLYDEELNKELKIDIIKITKPFIKDIQNLKW